MDTLPQDLLDQIASNLLPQSSRLREPYGKLAKPSFPLAPLAVLSRSWQVAVERLTFKSIRIDSDELSEFIRLYAPERRRLLSELTFTALIPAYSSTAALRAESPEERAANDESYTQAVLSLFQTLKTWEVENPKIADYYLDLAINHPESPSDRPWTLDIAPWAASDGLDCVHEGRYLHSFIDILRPEELPVLQRVKSLSMLRPEPRYGFRNVYPKVPLILASRMPNLETIRLHMDDDEKRFPDIRKRNREEVADHIRNISLPNLRRADFNFWTRRHRAESTPPPILHDPGIPDPLSSSIHEISHCLVSLDMTGVMDLTLLRPLQGLRDTPWPNLRFLDVDFHATTPSGDWYFTGMDDSQNLPRPRPDPGNSVSSLHEEDFSFMREAEFAYMSPMDTFRGKVSELTLVPFIDAYAEALSVMPKLTSSMFNCQLEYDCEADGEPAWFNMAYFAPCISAKNFAPKMICPNCNRGTTRQLVTSLMGWEPSEELGAKLRGIQDAYETAPMVEKDISEFIAEHECDLNI